MYGQGYSRLFYVWPGLRPRAILCMASAKTILGLGQFHVGPVLGQFYGQG